MARRSSSGADGSRRRPAADREAGRRDRTTRSAPSPAYRRIAGCSSRPKPRSGWRTSIGSRRRWITALSRSCPTWSRGTARRSLSATSMATVSMTCSSAAAPGHPVSCSFSGRTARFTASAQRTTVGRRHRLRGLGRPVLRRQRRWAAGSVRRERRVSARAELAVAAGSALHQSRRRTVRQRLGRRFRRC